MQHNISSFFEFLKSDRGAEIHSRSSTTTTDMVYSLHQEDWLERPNEIAIRYSWIPRMDCTCVDLPGASTSKLDDARSHDYSNSYPAIERVLKQMRARLNITPFSESNSRGDTFVGNQTLMERQIALQTSTTILSAKCTAVSNRDIALIDTDDRLVQNGIVEHELDDFNSQTAGGRAAHHRFLSVEDRQLEETNNGGKIHEKKKSVTTVAHRSRDEKVAHIRHTASNINCLRKRKVFIAKQLAVLSLNALSCPS